MGAPLHSMVLVGSADEVGVLLTLALTPAPNPNPNPSP